jgi:hypothetical protein
LTTRHATDISASLAGHTGVTHLTTHLLTPRPDLAPPVNLNGRGHYLHWGFLQVSVANVIVVAVIVAAFAVALFVPFPKPKGRD